jgi:chromosome segregation ATPase
MLKKALVVVGVLLVGGWLWRSTDLGSYIKTGWSEFRQSIKKEVPIDFEIKRAKTMLVSLDRAEEKLMGALAAEMVAVKRLERDIQEIETSLARQKEEIQALNQQLKSDLPVYYTTNGQFSKDQLTRHLERRFKDYKNTETMLKSKRELLAEHQERLRAIKEQREGLKFERANLATRIEKLETDLAYLKARESRSKNVPEDAQLAELARLKEMVDGLEKRIDEGLVKLQLREADNPTVVVPAPVPGNPHITQEIDEYFNTPKPAEKVAENK